MLGIELNFTDADAFTCLRLLEDAKSRNSHEAEKFWNSFKAQATAPFDLFGGQGMMTVEVSLYDLLELEEDGLEDFIAKLFAEEFSKELKEMAKKAFVSIERE